MTIRKLGAMLAVFALVACEPGATRKFEAVPSPAPSAELARTFAGCTWGKVTGARGLAIWGFACGPQFGNVHLAADDALPGFVIESTGPEGVDRRPVVRIFSKPPGAAPSAALDAVRAASPGPATATCEFAPAAGVDHEGRQDFELGPTGAAKTAFDAAIAANQMPEPPCGPLGVSGIGDRIFRALPGDPGSLAWIDFGSEIQIFDATTLTREMTR